MRERQRDRERSERERLSERARKYRVRIGGVKAVKRGIERDREQEKWRHNAQIAEIKTKTDRIIIAGGSYAQNLSVGVKC